MFLHFKDHLRYRLPLTAPGLWANLYGRCIALHSCVFLYFCGAETDTPVRHAAPRLHQSDGGDALGQEAAGHLLQSGLLWTGEPLAAVADASQQFTAAKARLASVAH